MIGGGGQVLSFVSFEEKLYSVLNELTLRHWQTRNWIATPHSIERIELQPLLEIRERTRWSNILLITYPVLDYALSKYTIDLPFCVSFSHARSKNLVNDGALFLSLFLYGAIFLASLKNLLKIGIYFCISLSLLLLSSQLYRKLYLLYIFFVLFSPHSSNTFSIWIIELCNVVFLSCKWRGQSLWLFS